jgi:hypothetical protein
MRAFLLVLLFPAAIWCRESFTMIGPMFHLNFGGGRTAFSIALEWSYWSYPSPIHYARVEGPTYGMPDGKGYGVDAGAEWEIRGNRSKFRLYGESQFGWEGHQGLALGPVLEFPLESGSPRVGIQGSGWFTWADLRLRYIGEEAFFCPGLFVKFTGNNPY